MYGLDLFSGIGGITESLEGYVKPIAYCERERSAIAILLSRIFRNEIPNAPVWDDVQTLRGGALPIQPEIIYGGFPCQDFSIAGHGKGLDGERSILFEEMLRLVSEIRPKFVFMENVPKIVDRGGLLAVTRELTKLRYDTRWGVLSSGRMGANHLRRRWWLLAYATGERCSGMVQSRKGRRADIYRPLLKERFDGQAPLQIPVAIPFSQASQGVRRMDDGVPEELYGIRALGNGVDPRVSREAFERLMGIKQ